MISQQQKPDLNYKRPLIIGIVAIIVLLGGSLAWASLSSISGAIITTGTVAVEGKPKSIQHLDGGIVSKIHIKTGDIVKNQDVLIELDDTAIKANLTIYKSRLKDAIIKRDRLQAELENKQSFDIPTTQLKGIHLGSLKKTYLQQVDLLQARHSTNEARHAQLDEKVAQFGNQINGLKQLILEKKIQIALLQYETDKVAALTRKKLAVESRLSSLKRNLSDLRGQIAEHGAEIARVKNSIAETKIAKLQVDREFREKVITELEQIDPRLAELLQQVLATQAQLDRIIIRSPVDGIIHELNLFTVGGVVQSGQTLMQIIPQSGKFDFKLSVDIQSIDQLYPGQRTIIRLPAFHQKNTPQLEGNLVHISPTSVIDENTGVAFYRVKVRVPDTELHRLEGKVLVPGMPVEGFIVSATLTAPIFA